MSNPIASLARRLGLRSPFAPRRQERRFEAARLNRLSSDWITSPLDANEEIRGDLSALRTRSRESAQNDSLMRRYLRVSGQNIVYQGIALQMGIANADGTPDTIANDIIERAWKDWGRPENCTPQGRLSWWKLEHLACRTLKRDGEFFALVLRGKGRYGYQVQPLDADYCDHTHCENLRNGNQVVNGVEITADGTVVAYWLWKYHPNATQRNPPGQKRIRYAAADVIHVYDDMDRPGVYRGFPHAHAALNDMHILRGYREAELIAARVAACKMGFVERPPLNDPEQQDEASKAAMQWEAEPGSFGELRPGEKMHEYSPEHPTSAYPDFVKAAKRDIAGGLGVAYNTFANDLEGVSYATGRMGLLDERDGYAVEQMHLIDSLHRVVFEEWLRMSLTAGVLALNNGATLRLSQYDKYNQPKWKPRRWQWVDPRSDAAAMEIQRHYGWITDTDIASSLGYDWEENHRRREIERTIREKHGEPEPSRNPNAQVATSEAANANE